MERINAALLGNMDQTEGKKKRVGKLEAKPINEDDFTPENELDARRFVKKCRGLDEQDQKEWQRLRAILLGPDLREASETRSEESTKKM
ncbi:hypothetical protein ACLMJK_004250 [Lecanora helva]